MFLGEMIFIRDGLKTLINGDFEILDDFRISQKYNPQIPKSDLILFLGTFLGIFLGMLA